MKAVSKPWGWEFWVVNNELYCWKVLVVQGGAWSGGGLHHLHVEKDETFYVASGTLLLDVGGDCKALRSGDVFRVFPKTPHRFRSKQVTVYEVSTHHDDDDVIHGTLEMLAKWKRE